MNYLYALGFRRNGGIDLGHYNEEDRKSRRTGDSFFIFVCRCSGGER